MGQEIDALVFFCQIVTCHYKKENLRIQDIRTRLSLEFLPKFPKFSCHNNSRKFPIFFSNFVEIHRDILRFVENVSEFGQKISKMHSRLSSRKIFLKIARSVFDGTRIAEFLRAKEKAMAKF